MQRGLFVLVLAVVLMPLVGCSNPVQGTPTRAILIHAPADSVMKIGTVVTFSWECVNCSSVRATQAQMYIVAGGAPLSLFSGPLTGSAQWVVGTADDSRSLPGGLFPPGEYALRMYSANTQLACNRDCPEPEASSTPDALRIQLVR